MSTESKVSGPKRRYLARTICGDPHSYHQFRFPELESLGLLAGCKPPLIEYSMASEDCPYVPLTIDAEDVAKFFAQRTIATQGFYELLGTGRTLPELMESIKQYPAEFMAEYGRPDLTWSIHVESYGRKYKDKEQEELRQHLRWLDWKGKVSVKEPTYRFWYMIDVGVSGSREPRRYYFCREIVQADSYAHRYSLSDRKCIGPTSTAAELAFLMANQALARPGSVCYDPFVGTGSILVACGKFGALCYGSEFDFLLLHGRTKGSKYTVLDNFEQYGLPPPEILCADASRPSFRRNADGHLLPWLDAVVGDPPYGVRAGARRSGTKKQVKEIPESSRETHIPGSQAYEVEDVMTDLLENSAQALKVGGRLVYLLPTTTDFDNKDLPSHPCLEIVSVSEQLLRRNFSRRLVTMRKVRDCLPGDQVARRDKLTEKEPGYANVRAKIFLPSAGVGAGAADGAAAAASSTGSDRQRSHQDAELEDESGREKKARKDSKKRELKPAAPAAMTDDA